jgi:uncharacterized membrane protein
MRFNITEKGLITFVVVVVCFTLLLTGKDTVVGYTLLGVVAGYFGIEFIPPRIGRKKNGGT